MNELEAFETYPIGRMALAMGGALLALLEPTLPYITVCTVFIFADCYTAWQLSRRVKKKHPKRTRRGQGKFESRHFGKVLMTLLKAYALIIMGHLIGKYITNALPIDMAKVAAGAICFWQLWSILENESSCNGAKWAKIAQRIFVDKTERHLDIDLRELKGEQR